MRSLPYAQQIFQTGNDCPVGRGGFGMVLYGKNRLSFQRQPFVQIIKQAFVRDFYAGRQAAFQNFKSRDSGL